MSTPKSPKPAKLIIGLFMKEKSLIDQVTIALSEKAGPVDMVSNWFSFDQTSYYEPEMGAPLFRRILVFKNLIDQGDLADIKCITNSIEKDFAKDGKRQINIDPGYLLLERFVLATGKNYTHRIYIGKGIFADLTLIYQKNKFQILPWTYPDYAQPNMLEFLDQVRNKYRFDLKGAQ